MAHVSLESFSSEGVLGVDINPNQKSYNAQLIFFSSLVVLLL